MALRRAGGGMASLMGVAPLVAFGLFRARDRFGDLPQFSLGRLMLKPVNAGLVAFLGPTANLGHDFIGGFGHPPSPSPPVSSPAIDPAASPAFFRPPRFFPAAREPGSSAGVGP